MPDWNQILNQMNAAGSVHDIVRRQFLKQLNRVTKRNVIIYYSGWLQKRGIPGLEINDEDKNGLMTVIHGLDRKSGLDLVLHTPGGDTASTESLVDYLRSMFKTDIRAIVPQLAMSGGTMIACACESIVMGKQSSLGPVDPHFNGVSAHGVTEEFERAADEIKRDQSRMAVWQPIIAKYRPAFVGDCEKAIAWSTEMVQDWLRTGMFKGDSAAKTKIDRIVAELTSHAITKSHARHLSADKCRELGLHIEALEDDQRLQDAVLSVHHACMLTFAGTPAIKIIENHKGVAFVKIVRNMVVAQGPSDFGVEGIGA